MQAFDVDRVTMIVLRSMRAPLLILLSVYSIGVAGFALIPGRDGEPMSFLHALYFLSYTATTTGFGELPSPYSAQQRMWAIVMLHLSVIGWAYSLGAMIRLANNRHFRNALAQRRFSRRVAAIAEPFVVICGFGDAGSILARRQSEQGRATVIIDRDEDRIKALSTRNYETPAPGVCADATDPRVLQIAGTTLLDCRAVVAVCDDDETNARIAVMTRALNPSCRVLCRISDADRAAEIDELGGVLVLDAFEIFAQKLGVALHRPALHTLGEWLASAPGVSLDSRIACPHGLWIVYGYGRMGHRLEAVLSRHGIEVTVIDPALPEDDASDHAFRGRATLERLHEAGLDRAACVISATDDDAENIRVTLMLRGRYPDLFLVSRQNRHGNAIAFDETGADLVMHPDRVISRHIFLELTSPGLVALLDELESCSEDRLYDLLGRLRDAVGEGERELWTLSLDPAVASALADPDIESLDRAPTIGDLLHHATRGDDGRREAGGRRHDAVALVLERDRRRHTLPELDSLLRLRDRLLFVSTPVARRRIEATLCDAESMWTAMTGEVRPRGWLMKSLSRDHTPSTRDPLT